VPVPPIIGQAVKGISDGTRAIEPAVPWRQIAGMRDKLIHEYFGVDLVLVWDVVERELPVLRAQLKKLSQRLADQTSSEGRPAS
jgi:uncharacterized protein with HEPN domain